MFSRFPNYLATDQKFSFSNIRTIEIRKSALILSQISIHLRSPVVECRLDLNLLLQKAKFRFLRTSKMFKIFIKHCALVFITDLVTFNVCSFLLKFYLKKKTP